MESLFIVIFTIVFMGLGSCLLIYSFQQRSRIKRAQNWHTTQAKIQSLDYFDHYDEGQEVKIIYDYMIRGKAYQGSRVAFGYGRSSHEKYHQKIYDILRKKSTLTIYYNPQQTEQSVISLVPGKGIKLGIFAGTFFILWGMGFLVTYLINWQFLQIVIVIGMAVIFLLTFSLLLSTLALKVNDPLIRDLVKH